MKTLSIPAFAAGLEHIWSIAGNNLKDNRMTMSPLLFDLLSFLKLKNYLDDPEVSEAMR